MIRSTSSSNRSGLRALICGLAMGALGGVAGCGGGSTSATGTGNAAAPTTAALTATTPPTKLFSTDFEAVCGGASVSRATTYDKTKPSGHKLMYFADFQESGLVEQSSGVPSEWTVLFDANADAFTAIDLVACAKRGEATFVKDCDGYEKDKQPTQNVVKMFDATYAVSVREASTGKELASTSIVATSSTCPMIMSFEGTNDTVKSYAQPKDDDLVPFLKPFVQPG